jgi:transcriptional regulator with XRE-family HTH domain
MALGKQIRMYRAKLGLTLEALAAKCEGEIEVGTISALEVRDSQRSKYAAPIARALGLTVEQLLDETRDWITHPAPAYSLTVPAPPPIAAQYLHPRLGHIATREVEVLLALRDIPQRARDRFIAELMQAHEEATQFATEVLARHGNPVPVPDARVADALPEHPGGPQPDSIRGGL